MTTDDLETLVMADALGVLDEEGRRTLSDRLASISSEERVMVARWYDSATASVLDGVAQVPPAGGRDRLLGAIRQPAQYTVSTNHGWADSGLPGIQAKVLAVDHHRGQVTLVLRGEVGATYPAHRHSTPEECYVVKGSIAIGDLVLRAGDFHHADAHSQHEAIVALEPAEVLLVGAIADYLPS